MMLETEKINIIKILSSKENGIDIGKEGYFGQSNYCLEIKINIYKHEWVSGYFFPNFNASILLLNANDLFTNTQCKYLSKQINDAVKQAYKKNEIRTIFFTDINTYGNVISVMFPVEFSGKNKKVFDKNEQFQSLIDFKKTYFKYYDKIFGDAIQILDGNKQFPIFSPPNLLIKNNIDSKEDLLLTTEVLFLLASGEENDSSIYAIMNIRDLFIIFNRLIDIYPEHKEQIIKGLRIYYNSSNWFDFSDAGIQNFLIDVRNKFIIFSCYQ